MTGRVVLTLVERVTRCPRVVVARLGREPGRGPRCAPGLREESAIMS